MKRPSHVVIVGKPNSGKSTLFNRITGSRKAITHSTPGVTRDRMEENVTWNGVEFTLVDTGGFNLENDPLQRQITERIKKAVFESSVIIFLTDVETGPTAEDENLLRDLRSRSEDIILVVNKVESETDELNTYEFHKFGLGRIFNVSALHGAGVGDLLDEIVSRLPRRPAPRVRSALKIAIVGKPNVGKSSLVNALVGEDRHIVAEEPGTTRDSINIRLRYHGREIVLIDTAGLKRRSRTARGLPVISSLKSLGSVREADIVLVVIDATTGVSRQDTRIAAAGHKARKGVAVLVNKWDTVEKKAGKIGEYIERIRGDMPFLSYAPILTVSALTGMRLERIFPMCLRIQKEREKRIGTTELNRLMELVAVETPPRYYRGGTGRVYYITQTGILPPTFTLFVNKSSYFPRSYIRYLNNKIRKMFTFDGTAIRISLKSKGR